jgi:hypothetical protein
MLLTGLEALSIVTVMSVVLCIMKPCSLMEVSISENSGSRVRHQ